MTHIWIRGEQRLNEGRVGVSPAGVKALIEAGYKITIEHDPARAISLTEYPTVDTAPMGSWPSAPHDAVIMGLKELPDDASPLPHRHIMFGHAYKSQPNGLRLLNRFLAGGGTLYDLEYLTDTANKRVAAFGYWAGYAGAAIALKCWASAEARSLCSSVSAFADARALKSNVSMELKGAKPRVIIIGANGRVGSGARDLCNDLGSLVTSWDMAETAHGGPFPEILEHDIFLNCILANHNTPVFVGEDAKTVQRNLTVIGDIACDPDSYYSPIKVYDRSTSWSVPALRVHSDPILDVTAIDNLPSILPRESSEDFAAQLLPSLLKLDDIENGVWGKARRIFDSYALGLD